MERQDEIEQLHPVRVELWCPRGPELNWHVLEVRGTEALSDTYEFVLELVCDDPDADCERMLGADAELLFDRNGLTRTVYGIIVEFQLRLDPLGEQPQGLYAHAVLAPALALLKQELDTRFFLGQTALEILGERLGEALAPFGRSVDLHSRISGSYARRDYCVQFRESTLDFCARLMAEEGIAFVFEADADEQRERLVLVDNPQAYPPAELLVPGALPLAPHSPEELDRESLLSFEWRERQRANRVFTRAYNEKLPARPDEGEAEERDAHHHRERAEHHHGLRRQIIDDPVEDPRAESFDGSGLEQAPTHAALLLQRRRVEASGGKGSSNAIGLAAGTSFEAGEARVAKLAGGEHELLLLRVTHEARTREGGGGEHDYRNHFECSSRATPFRPSLPRDKPRVHGVLTGVVVGPSPDELHVDGLGRVKVQLHGDRHGQGDDHSSCWIRVAQSWAGPGYGAMVIPRVGMEVVVTFVDGDPDQPLVTGCVYNGDNAPPGSLPDAAAQSTFKSSSTPGGEGFNELRVDDNKGREQIFVHAQGRLDVRAKGKIYETSAGRELVVGGAKGSEREDPHGDSNTLIHRDQNHKVRGDSYQRILGDLHLGVADLYRLTTKLRHRVRDGELSAKQLLVEVEERISSMSDELVLSASSTMSAKAGERLMLESNRAIELRVGSSFIALYPDRVDIQAPRIRLNSGGSTGSASEAGRAEAWNFLWPIDAYSASSGRPGGAGGGGGSGGGGGGRGARVNEAQEVMPYRAPPMTPPLPPLPDPEDVNYAGQRAPRSLSWLSEELWCSQTAELLVRFAGEADANHNILELCDADSGEVLGVQALHDGGGDRQSHYPQVCNIAARATSQGPEPHRKLLARLSGVSTPAPLRLRFLSNLPALRGKKKRFDIWLDRGEVIVGGVIEYTRGEMHYVITLGEHVPPQTGGLIDVEAFGTKDLRYCKRAPEQGGKYGLAYWNGGAWVPVPQAWTDPMGTKLYGLAVWMQDGERRVQTGKLPWPDALEPWSGAALDHVEIAIERFKQDICDYWNARFHLKRSTCDSLDPRCCRYPVRAQVSFVEVSHRSPGGRIILAQNGTRANSNAWAMDADANTTAHEFGHHLGNPDEYPGARSVNPKVNGDGAVAGIDEDGLMGSGAHIRRRYFNKIAEAMGELVELHLGQSFQYTVVDPL